MVIKFQAFSRLARSGKHKLAPLYVVNSHGEEFYWNETKTILSDILTKKHKAPPLVERFHVEGRKHPSLSKILNIVVSDDMFSPACLVVISNADSILKGFAAPLIEFCDNHSSKGIILLLCQSADRRLKVIKKADALGTLIDGERIYEERLAPWIINRAREKGLKLDPDLPDTLIELVGANLIRIDRELEKIKTFAGTRKTIHTDDIYQVVGYLRSRDFYKLLDAIISGRKKEAPVVLREILSSGTHPATLAARMGREILLLWKAWNHFRSGCSTEEAALKIGSKFRAPHLRKQFDLLRGLPGDFLPRSAEEILAADRDLKGSGQRAEVIMERMVYDILHLTNYRTQHHTKRR